MTWNIIRGFILETEAWIINMQREYFHRTLCSISSRVVLSFRKLSFSRWACWVIWVACFLRVASRSWTYFKKRYSICSVITENVPFRSFLNTQQITRLAVNGAPLVVCDLAKELLRVSLLLLILSALALQLLELQVLETLGLQLQHFTVLNINSPNRT